MEVYKDYYGMIWYRKFGSPYVKNRKLGIGVFDNGNGLILLKVI